MHKDGYKIIDITGGHESNYGNVIIVKANPNIKNGTRNSYSLVLDDTTETFVLLHDEIKLHNIVNIAKGDTLWYPYENHFYDDTVFDQNTNKAINIHRDVDFFEFEDDFYGDVDNEGENDDDDNVFLLIPNLYYKVQFLREQYLRGYYNIQYPTFKSYVESQTEEDAPIFWRWLFENPDFTDDMTGDIPDDYKKEFEKFLDFCEEY